MDLTTRCPQCSIEFPVSLQQLQLRKGYVRCANCAHIFDAYEAVVPTTGVDHTLSSTAPKPSSAAAEPALPSSELPLTSPQSATATKNEPHFVVSHTGAEPGVAIRTRGVSSRPSTFTVRDPGPSVIEESRHTLQDRGHDAHTSRHTVGEPSLRHGDMAYPDVDSGLYVEPRPGRESGPDFIHDDEPAGLGWGGVFWSLLVLVGVAGALLQAAYIYRVQLASELPQLRPALESYCQTLGCTVEYPRRLAQIAIMDSSLQALRDGEEAGHKDGSRMMLNVVLRNNYEKPQQWPSLSVELVDFSGTVAVRRLLAPADYLPELSQGRPFPAKSEVRVSVPLTVSGVQVNGYQLDRFFP